MTSYAEDKAAYWTRVAVRTGKPEHARAARFWNDVAGLRRETQTALVALYPHTSNPPLSFGDQLRTSKIVETFCRLVGRKPNAEGPWF